MTPPPAPRGAADSRALFPLPPTPRYARPCVDPADPGVGSPPGPVRLAPQPLPELSRRPSSG